MNDFNIIDYLGGLTSFVFDKSILERIALDRKVANVSVYEELTKEQKDLCLADLLYTAYVSPNVIASSTMQHGAYANTVGAQTINSKQEIYNVMSKIYQKYGDEDKLDLIPNIGGNLQWIE